MPSTQILSHQTLVLRTEQYIECNLSQPLTTPTPSSYTSPLGSTMVPLTSVTTGSLNSGTFVVANPSGFGSNSVGDAINVSFSGSQTLTAITMAQYAQPNSSLTFFSSLALTKPAMLNDKNINRLENERSVFLRMKDELLRSDEYREKYVAFHEGRLVDHDVDLKRLATRVYEKYGYVPIYMDKVTEKIRKFENSSHGSA